MQARSVLPQVRFRRKRKWKLGRAEILCVQCVFYSMYLLCLYLLHNWWGMHLKRQSKCSFISIFLLRLVAQMVKNLSSVQETWIWSWKVRTIPLWKGIAIQYSMYFCLEHPMKKGACRAIVHVGRKEKMTELPKLSLSRLKMMFKGNI